METKDGSLETLVQEKLDADTIFTTSLNTMTDEEKETALNAKKVEIIEAEIASLKKKGEDSVKNKEVADNYKVRAEKAEDEVKKLKKDGGGGEGGEDGKKVESDEYVMTDRDQRALINGKVHEDDIDEITDYAKLKKITVAEALEADVVKTIISTATEHRKTAEAASTDKDNKGGAGQISDEALMAAADKGEIPEKGSPEAERLFWLRRNRAKDN